MPCRRLAGTMAEFTTLLPPVGDPYLKIQRTAARRREPYPGCTSTCTSGRLHESAARAEALGAEVVHRSEHGYVVLRSPGGFVFCFVHEPPRPACPGRPGGRRSTRASSTRCASTSRPTAYEIECTFWSELTGWPLRGSVSRPEFRHLVRPDGIPLRLLLQRLGRARRRGRSPGTSTWPATTGRTEVARHVGLGAIVVADHGGGWTTLRDPTGALYCITDRDPRSGLGDADATPARAQVTSWARVPAPAAADGRRAG